MKRLILINRMSLREVERRSNLPQRKNNEDYFSSPLSNKLTMTGIFKLSFIIIALFSASLYAKVDLVTLPQRDTVQLTIYNSADMTLARESRALTLKEGVNELQFSWENTLIDPTSLELQPKEHAGEIDITYLTFPPRVRNLGLWNINSEISGKVPVEITYLTSGLSWRHFIWEH